MKEFTVSPKEYEKQVCEWFRKTGLQPKDFRVSPLKTLPGISGEYEFDVVVEFTIVGGAKIVVLVECKRYSSPVKRDVIMALKQKMDEVGAHKAIVFSTSGFQSGALDFAKQHGIATVVFVDGKSTYRTKSLGGHGEPPPWVHLPQYAGWFLVKNGNTVCESLLDEDRVDPLVEWLGVSGKSSA